MSGIYIPNIKMPKSCITGKLPYYEYCPFFGGCSKRTSAKTERPSDCPLKEVPTHGRLIDADILCKMLLEAVHTSDAEWIEKYKSFIFDVVTPIIADCPTIIEASTEERE